MTYEQLKKLQDLIKDGLRPIKDLVEMIKKTVDLQQLTTGVASDNIRSIKEQQSLMNEKLHKLTEVSDQHVEALVTIENTINVYSDMYKMNNDHVKKLKKQLETLEHKSGTQPPPELTLAAVQ